MKRWAAPFMALALVACGQSAPQTDAPEAEATEATALQDPLRAAARLYAQAQAEPGAQGLIVPIAEIGGFDLIDCLEEYRSMEPGNPAPADEQIAQRMALLSISLERAGYPMNAMQPILDRFEVAEQALAAEGNDVGPGSEAFDARMQALAAELDDVRAALAPDLQPVITEGGCGAGETQVHIRTLPEGGRSWLITRFAFDLCQARKLDPWNMEACPRWAEADPEAPMMLSGAYKWQVRWPDGDTARGDRRVAPSMDEAPQTMTLANG